MCSGVIAVVFLVLWLLALELLQFDTPWFLQGAVESLRLALGGTVAKAGALNDCPFQGDSSGYNSGQNLFTGG